jgi:hypothetical protein
MSDSGTSGNIFSEATSNYLLENHGSGQNTAFKAKIAGGYTNLVTGNSILIPFDTEVFDCGACYENSTSYNYIAMQEGIHRLQCNLRAQDIQIATYSITYRASIIIRDEDSVTQDAIIVNQSFIDSSDPSSTDYSLGYWPFIISDIVFMERGWTAEVQLYQSAGAATLDLDDNSSFTGYYLRDNY